MAAYAAFSNTPAMNSGRTAISPCCSRVAHRRHLLEVLPVTQEIARSPAFPRSLRGAVLTSGTARKRAMSDTWMSTVKSAVPVSTLVVDDEELARSLLCALVRRNPDLILAGECSDGAAALDMAASKRPDLVFLDIQMPVLNGMAVAEKLATLDPAPYIIFVTAFDDYAIRAFELHALDYLVKPIEKERFKGAVERATTAIRNQEMLSLTERLLQLGRARNGHAAAGNAGDHELIIRSGDSIVQLNTGDIIWIEAANQYVHIHTEAKTFTASESLSQYAKRITDPQFFRIHRSAIVNCSAIAGVTKKRNGTHVLKLRNGSSLVVARSRAAMIPSILRAARSAACNL